MPRHFGPICSVAAALALATTGCAPNAPLPLGDLGLPADAPRSCVEDSGMVVETPEVFAGWREGGFGRYTELAAPSGGVVRIFVGDGTSDAKAIRARSILRWFLEDVAGSAYGSDKSAVMDSMASNDAVLMLPGGAHEPGDEPPFDAQPLFNDEITLEGSAWYLESDWDHRDASFEEIFHLLHDTGIGTYLPGALPEYQAQLDAEARLAMLDGRWGIPVVPDIQDWLEELEAEDSLAQEYIAAVIDSYYGYWGAFDEEPGGMWGIYAAGTREEIYELDPAGGFLLESFLPEMVGYEARLDSEFLGTFRMSFDASEPYTYKSQYLLNVTLTGDSAAAIVGNAADNELRGNGADNILDGGDGEDTVVFCHGADEATFERAGDSLIVTGPAGRDELRSVEHLHFLDLQIATSDF